MGLNKERFDTLNAIIERRAAKNFVPQVTDEQPFVAIKKGQEHLELVDLM